MIMRKSLVLMFCIFVCYGKMFSQHIYYGYPSDSIVLKERDRIIVNIPTFNVDHKTFMYEYQFFDFVHLLERNPTKMFRVEIHYFFTIDSSFAKYSSDGLCNDFKGIMSKMSNQTNYYTESKGCMNPIYSYRDEYYWCYNTRMEIVVE